MNQKAVFPSLWKISTKLNTRRQEENIKKRRIKIPDEDIRGSK